MSWVSPCITEELLSIPWLADSYQLKPIQGGVINGSYALDSNGKRFYLKVFSAENLNAINRPQAYSLQRSLAQMKFAPEPLYLSRKGLFQVESWLHIETIDSNQYSGQQKIQLLAGALTFVHRLNVPAIEIPLVAQWLHYLRLIPKNKDQWQRRIQLLQDRWYRVEKNCLCHHDLSFGHICVRPKGVILDWEYAARSNRYFDIACALLINQMEPQACQWLYRHYANENNIDVEELVNKVGYMLPLAKLTADLWTATLTEGESQSQPLVSN
ncbi:phosphotransferase [Alteromonadaceae bacterium BrNp21-10]|nr:phosphotransferase [Alteromonadaceae bacterium BrNp21-10]